MTLADKLAEVIRDLEDFDEYIYAEDAAWWLSRRLAVIHAADDVLAAAARSVDCHAANQQRLGLALAKLRVTLTQEPDDE